MDLGIQGRVAVVTAASKGLGRATAEALAAEGVSLVLSARGEDALAALAGELAARGAKVVTVPGDVSRPDVPARLVERALDRFGRLDIVVANAGGPPPGRALEVTDEQILSSLEANLLASVRLVRAAVPVMAEAAWGRICCITSYSVVQPVPRLALSNTARTGLWAWAKTAAHDLAGSGITLNLACPGPHATDRMRELGGSGALGDPGDFGQVVAFLCSQQAGFVNGAAVVVDGGASICL
ncbi:MAG: SDR family oxidoreductase [Actinomycetota bacterium]|jgi:3-oxoacyl-[acyl-carrier protein] reductase|nr:SDR family oxidoreductase [Actinomycetota bacterium]